MRGSSRAAAFALAALFSLLFALLILLSSGLSNVRLQPGSPIFMPDAETAERGEGTSLPLPSLTRSERILAYCLGGLTALSILLALISRKLRKLLFQQLFSMIAIILPILLGAIIVGRLIANWFRRHSTDIPDPGPSIPEALLSNPPPWAIALSAVAIGLVLTGIVLYAIWRGNRLRAYFKRRSDSRAAEEALRDDVADAAESAARRIRDGSDAHSEVIRCYRDMMRLLSKRGSVPTSYLTPREFETALRHLGISDQHISRLTEIFELVRYGERADAGFRDQALACLDAVTLIAQGELIA